MRAVLALAFKDLRIFSRSKSAMFFTFGWPLIVAVLFGMMFGGSNRPAPRLGVAVVDEDGTAQSKAFVDTLAASASLDVARLSRDEALEAVRTGRRMAALVLARGFGEARERLFAGTPPTVDVWIDPSREAEAGLLEGVLMQHGAEVLQELFNDPVRSQARVRTMLDDLRRSGTAETQPQLEVFLGQLETFLGSSSAPPVAMEGTGAGTADQAGWQPLRVTRHELLRERTGPRSGYDVTFPQAMLWAIFGCVMSFGGSFVTERVRGTFVRLQVSPMSRGQILAGKATAAFLAIVGVLAVLLALGVVAFGVRPVSWPALLAAVVCVAAAFVGIILLLASTLKTEHAVGGIGPAVMMPLFLLGGAMIPLMVMPAWMLAASRISPVTWAILAFEGAIWRGFGPLEMLLPCGILLAVGVVTFVIGARIRG